MKTFVINTSDRKIKRKAQALCVISSFIENDVNTLDKFMDVVLKEYPELNTFEHSRKLVLFWQFRNFDYGDKLESIVNKLNHA